MSVSVSTVTHTQHAEIGHRTFLPKTLRKLKLEQEGDSGKKLFAEQITQQQRQQRKKEKFRIVLCGNFSLLYYFYEVENLRL